LSRCDFPGNRTGPIRALPARPEPVEDLVHPRGVAGRGGLGPASRFGCHGASGGRRALVAGPVVGPPPLRSGHAVSCRGCRARSVLLRDLKLLR
jgi:hypothetical protein